MHESFPRNLHLDQQFHSQNDAHQGVGGEQKGIRLKGIFGELGEDFEEVFEEFVLPHRDVGEKENVEGEVSATAVSRRVREGSTEESSTSSLSRLRP